MNKQKEYLNRVSTILGEITTSQEDLKILKSEMSDELGKDQADKIIKLAKLIEKAKVDIYMSEAEEIAHLYKEIYG